MCPFTSVGKSAVKRHFEKVHVSQDCISPKLLSQKAIKKMVVKEEMKIQDNSGSHEVTSKVESQLGGIVEQFKSGKRKTEDVQAMLEHVVAAEGHAKESEVAKDTTSSDTRPEEKKSKHDELKNVSSKGISLAQHKKRSREDRENFVEESEEVGQVSLADMNERRRAPLTQSNRWFSGNVANNCAIQISLDSLGLFRGVIPSQTSKCL